jgi:hypothetical protein
MRPHVVGQSSVRVTGMGEQSDGYLFGSIQTAGMV